MPKISKPRIRLEHRGGQLVPKNIRASAYEGGSTRKRMAGKGMSVAGPNTGISQSLGALQKRSRNAVRNNAYATGAKETYVSNLVGTGIRPQWQNKEIQELWETWVQECDADGVNCFYGLQSLAAGAQFEAGEVLGRFRYRRTSDGLSVPLQLQLIESEHLDPTYSAVTDRQLIKMGIEFNAIGKRSAYWLWQHHPHEYLAQQANRRKRVPADDVIHLYRRTRPGQIRGVPELSSVIVRLYEIDEMQDALLARQKLAQLFAAFIQRKPDHDPDDEGPHFGLPADPYGEEEGEQLDEFVPGALHYLEDGEEVQFSNPPDIGAHYSDWLRTELLAVARGAGITYEQLTNDLKGVNYSSIRAGLLEFRRRAEALQAHLIVHQWCRKIAAKWLDVAVVSGSINLPDYWVNRKKYLAIDWIAPKWAWVDPLKEVTADLLEVRAGFIPRSEAAGQRGWSLEQLDEEIRKSNQSADDHGLILDSDPRITQKNGALQKAIDILNNEEEEENAST